MSKKSFRGALNQLDLHKKNKEAEIPGILGFTVNGVQVVNVPYRPGYVYVRLRNNTSEVIQAFNENINALYNLPVIVIRDEVDRSRYKIKGRDLGAYQNWGTSNLYVADHTHSFFQGFLAFDDAVFIATGVALDLKEDLYATAAGTTISVGVVTGTFSRDGHTHPQYSTGSASVGGGGSSVLVYDDSNFKVTGTALSFGANINVVVTGSTAFISSIDTVGGGGGADLLIYDNALFKVTGTALNFGDNLDVVVSGTTAYITAVGVTGSAGQQGLAGADGDNTLLIYDDLVFKVTGTALAFGNNINVVVTGSTAFISSVDTVGGGGGGSDLLIYDDSVFKVTGTAISFDNNLSVAVTGTTAFVSALSSSGGRTLIAETNPAGVTGTSLTIVTGTYRTLEIEYVCRSTVNATNTSLLMYFNGDNVATNYRRTRDGGFGAGTAQTSGGDDAFIGFVAGATSGANDCGSGFIKIINFADSYFNKQSNSLYSTRMDTSSSQVYVQIVGHAWENTAPITDIDFVLLAGVFVTGSNFRVYGLN